MHDSAWTATARHADIVLPATMTLEREDIGASAGDPLLVAMHRAVAPFGEARDDYDIFADLAGAWASREAFTEGRSAASGSNISMSRPVARLLTRGVDAPDFDQFWEAGELVLPTLPWDGGILRDFRHDPDAAPLPTPSGKIEIASATIAGFGYRGLSRTSRLAAAGRRRRLARGGAFPAPSDRQPAGDAAAQSAGFRRHQPGVEGQWARAGAHPSARCRGARHRATATSCASTTIAAPALPARSLSDALRPGVVQLVDRSLVRPR